MGKIMSKDNVSVANVVTKNRKLYLALRKSDFALQVRASMISKGLRNIDIAQRLGVSEANISRLLKGSQNVSLDTMYSLADAVEEPLSVVVGQVYPELEKFKDDEVLTGSQEGAGAPPCTVYDIQTYAERRRSKPVTYRKIRTIVDSGHLELCGGQA
jgi:transcriptional regulator with XRE-family HTH domain